MATYSKVSGYYTLQLEVVQQSQSVANNTSTLKWTLSLKTGSTYFSQIRVGYNVVIDGTTCANVSYSNAPQISMDRNETKQLATGTTTVTHNTDGTKTIAVGAITASDNTQTGNVVPNISLSNSTALTLTTIPRKSTVSASSGTILMGNNCAITVTQASSSFYHTLTYSFGSASGNIVSGRTQSTSVSWTIPKSLAAQIAAGSITGTGTITCTTYTAATGGSQIGTSTCTFKAQIPPTVPTTSASDNTMGKPRTISVSNRAASNLTHTIQYSFGSGAGVIATKTTSTSVSWTVPTSLAQYVATDNTSGSGDIIVTTFNGNAEVGSKTISFTAAIPASTMTVKTARMGVATPFEITRASSQLSHKITYTFSAASGYAAGSSSATVSNTSLTWTPPYSLANQINITGGVKSGTITYYLTTYNGTEQCGQTTYTATLNAPTASLNVPSSFVMGTASNIQTIDQDSNFAHTIVAQYSSTTQTFATNTTATNVPANFTIATWAPLIPTSKTLTVTIKQTVYSSSGSNTVVAYNEYTATVAVPDTAPTASISTAVVTSLTGAFASIYVQNNAQCQVTCTFASSTGAYIRSATMKIDGVTKNFTITGDNTSVTKSVTSDLLQTSGSKTITVKVTDSRGYTGTYTASITVVAYKNPTISAASGESKVIIERSNPQGTADPAGACLRLKFIRKISAITNNTGYVSYKVGSGTATTISTSSDGSETINQTLDLGWSEHNTYKVTVRVWDSVGYEVTRVVTIPSLKVTLDLRAGGLGVGVGMFSQGDNRFDVAWPSYFNESVIADRFTSLLGATNGGWSTFRVLPRWSYNDILSGTDGFPSNTYLEAWVKKIAETYPTDTARGYIGNVAPLQGGFSMCYIESCADVSGGLPNISTGIYVPYNSSTSIHRGAIVRFGTDNYTFWYNVLESSDSEEVTLTYSTGNVIFTQANFNSGFHLYRSGKICTLHVYATPSNQAGGSTFVTVGTIPSGYRPKIDIGQGVTLDSGTYTDNQIRITSGGNIQVYKNHTGTAGFRTNLTWII